MQRALSRSASTRGSPPSNSAMAARSSNSTCSSSVAVAARTASVTGPESPALASSAPSAAVRRPVIKGFARTVASLPGNRPSAWFTTVRRGVTENPLAGLGFVMGVDDADDADGSAPASSVPGECGVVVMWIVRVRARPSRPKLISTPTLRKKVAARRSRPARPRQRVVECVFELRGRRVRSAVCRFPRDGSGHHIRAHLGRRAIPLCTWLLPLVEN